MPRSPARDADAGALSAGGGGGGGGAASDHDGGPSVCVNDQPVRMTAREPVAQWQPIRQRRLDGGQEDGGGLMLAAAGQSRDVTRPSLSLHSDGPICILASSLANRGLAVVDATNFHESLAATFYFSFLVLAFLLSPHCSCFLSRRGNQTTASLPHQRRCCCCYSGAASSIE